MKRSSFQKAKLALDEACEFLRSFTLGRSGFTEKDGVAGVRRVIACCTRMEKLVAGGPNAAAAKMLVASAKSRVLAAQTRLALLSRR